MTLNERKILFNWLLTQKCPECESTQKTVSLEDSEINLGTISCQCKDCKHIWELDVLVDAINKQVDVLIVKPTTG